jgi:hypothetical protein
MSFKNKVITEIPNFRPSFGKFRNTSGVVYNRIGVGTDPDTDKSVVVLVDQESRKMEIVTEKYFKGKSLDIGHGFVNIFEPVH